MAKKKSKPTADAAPKKKPKPAKQPSRAGAVFGSILLFLLTLLFSIALLCSSILHSLLPQHTLSGSISQMDLSQVQLKDNGKTEQLGTCLYDWYFWDAPNLTEEYADVLVQQPEFNALFCNYLDDLSDYLTGDSSELPKASVEDIADLMQNDLGSTMRKETGVVFAEADRQSLEWTMGDDINAWNDALDSAVGSGFKQFAARMLCGMSGMITFGVLTIGCFVLWLILAVKKHWRKGRMLAGYGWAAAIPGLLVLAGCGVTLLLVEAFHVPDALLFTKKGLPTLVQPTVLATLIPAGYGVIFALIGIFTNAAVKKKQKKAALQKSTDKPAAPVETPAAEQPEFHYTEMTGDSKKDNTDASATAKFCPHCGAPNALNSQFCGSCGQKMK